MATILRTIASLDFGGAQAGLSAQYWLPGTPGGSVADATDVLGRVRGAWLSFASRISTGLTVRYLPEVLAINDATGALVGQFAAVPGAATVGTDAGELLPAQTQGLIQWNTAGVVGGRRVRGHTYLPFPCEGSNDSLGRPVSAYTTSISGFGTNMLGSGATASTNVIWHRPVGGAGGSSYPTTSSIARSTWSVLRSRR